MGSSASLSPKRIDAVQPLSIVNSDAVPPSSHNTLKCLYMNARSVAKQGAIDLLNAYTSIHNIDLVFITESWLGNCISNRELSCNDRYKVFRHDRDTRGGGVCILTRKELKCCEIRLSSDIEAVAVDMH